VNEGLRQGRFRSSLAKEGDGAKSATVSKPRGVAKKIRESKKDFFTKDRGKMR